jgi:SAM-dependent methyltransferase
MTSNLPDPKQRFSTRVEHYIRSRPGYPPGVIAALQQACGLSPASRVADVGSGTGLLTRLFLDLGCQVFGVEPNPEMRAAAERLLAGYPNFTSLDASAEATGLPDASVDLVAAGQAFHWFDPPRARQEFTRILRPHPGPGGWVALVWNDRRTDSTPFLRDYEALLQTYGTDYNQVNHRNVEASPDALPAFFGGPFQLVRFDNVQRFDYASLEGRLQSSSYVPGPGHPDHAPLLAGLRRIFDRHQQDGQVDFEYDTQLYYGRLAE